MSVTRRTLTALVVVPIASSPSDAGIEPGPDAGTIASADVELTNEWQPIHVVFDLTRDAKSLETFVLSHPPIAQSNSCFRSDDDVVWPSQ